MAYDGRYLRTAYLRVPDIGNGRRWYDPAYRFLRGFIRSWLGRKSPGFLKSPILYAIDFLHSINDHERNRIWSRRDTLHNVIVPQDEKLKMPGMWVVELFPPSELDLLRRSLEKNSWDARRVKFGFGPDNLDMLGRSRGGQGPSWWRIGHLVGSRGDFTHPDAKVGKLPEIFSSIELTATHIGDGLTAVVAFFRFSEKGSTALQDKWHATTEPRLVWRKGRLIAEDRMWATFRVTQEARRNLHDEARGWLAEVLPGAFARRGAPQPLIDLMLTERHDPYLGEKASRELSDALRALGVTEAELAHYKSDSFPGLLLDPVSQSLCPALPHDTWALWGNQGYVISVMPGLNVYGGENAHGISRSINDAVREMITLLSVTSYLQALQRDYAELRDEARGRHGKFSGRRLSKMRHLFLSLSLDMASTVRDVEFMHSRSRTFDQMPKITMEDPAWLARQMADLGRSDSPRNLTEILKNRQKRDAARLASEDKDYREILSTVASLGASIDTFKLGRIALWVSFVSLAVSSIALLVAEVQSDTLLSHVIELIKRHSR